MAECGSCHAVIVWAKVTSGALMPLDGELQRSGATERSAQVAVPTVFDDGNIVLEADGRARVVAPGAGQHRAHFASCPHAGSHRRRGSG